MVLIGLTGGIGSGKSTVSALLADRGATVIDADRITRELQEPGTEVFASIVDAFGPRVVAEDGRLDREGLAELVFNDRAELDRLTAIVHPAVGVEVQRRIEAAAGTDAVVVLDIPLLVESGRDDLALTVVVDLPPETAVERLVAQRGFDADDARARIANQVSRDERLAAADRVLDNAGTRDDLERQVDALWSELEALRG